MESLYQRLGHCTELRDIVELGVEDIPHYDPYDDESQNVKTFLMFDEDL